MILTEKIKRFAKWLKTKVTGRARHRDYHARSRYRVEIVNENTLGRLWSVRLSGVRVGIAAAAVVAAIASLISMIFLFTPLASFLPGRLEGDMRGLYLETALRVDSLTRVAREQDAYTRNILAILRDSIDAADANVAFPDSLPVMTIDSISVASEKERQFVRRFEEEERFNLSVLSPIAAEGMIFESPVMESGGVGDVSSIYRGAVISVFLDEHGRSTVIIQHPNDFLSVYNNLSTAYVAVGDKIAAAQRIGHTDAGNPLGFELWHSGSKLDASLYIPL